MNVKQTMIEHTAWLAGLLRCECIVLCLVPVHMSVCVVCIMANVCCVVMFLNLTRFCCLMECAKCIC